MENFSHLTKKERRQLHRQEKIRMEEQSRNRSAWRTWAMWGGITVVIAIIVWVWSASPNQQTPSQVSQIPAPTAQNNTSGTTDLVASRLSHETLTLDGKTTWQPNSSNLPALAQAFNLAPADPSLLHHHVHLDIFINGETVPVPQNIGLSPEAELPTHTHDATGIIHVEASDVNFKPTLGLFFDIWGVSFTEKNIGGYLADKTKGDGLAVFVNGKRYGGNPRQIPLNQHNEILIVFGHDYPNPMPASYSFPVGL